MTAEPRRTEVLSAALGAAVLAAAVVALTLAPPPAAAGDLAVPRPVVADSPGPEASGPEFAPTTSSQEHPERGAVVDAPAPPIGLSLPSLDVEADVTDVALEPDGAMEVPHDVDEVGWYRLGAAPGEPGVAVIAGHVDGRGQGPGAFWDLRTLEPGETFEVSHADGATTTWQVDARRSYGKDELPFDELFTREGPPRLALITCGGAFDRQAGSYEDNIVVYATPLEADAAVAG